MAGLTTGTIPAYYRELFDVLCPGKENKVERRVWRVCMKSATLPDTILQQIWDQCDPSGTGHISRDAFYRSLALCALAQQGKPVDEKSLVLYGEAELPSPKLASMSELRSTCMKVVRATRPTELGYSYEELKAMDDVIVNLLPEKKGMVFKHVEYLVESKSFKSSVRRRYKDFEALHELLLTKYPYRLVPRLPPKKLNNLSAAFIEQRRRALKRFLLLVVRHPVLAKDDITKIFLSAGGQDVGAKLKDKFKTPHDEYTFNPYSKKVEDLVSDATRVKYDRVREQISVMHQVVSSMLSIAQNMETRSMALSSDMKQFATNMTTLSTDSLLMSSWTSGDDETWSYMQRDFASMGAVFKSISDKAHQQARRETSGFTESVHQFLDLIVSYEDLCERREAVVRRHQKALAKVKTMVKHKERIESTGGHMTEREDTTIIRRDDELIQIEKRNFFSLFCLNLEAQLIHANLAQLIEVFKVLTAAQVNGQTEYLRVWDELKSVVDGMGMVKGIGSPGSGTSPTRPSHLLPAAEEKSPFT